MFIISDSNKYPSVVFPYMLEHYKNTVGVVYSNLSFLKHSLAINIHEAYEHDIKP